MVQWPQRGSTVTRASRDALADLPHGLGGGDRILVARHQHRGTGDPADLGRAGVRQRLAGARVAVRALSHDELSDRRHRHRPPRPRLGRDRPLHELIGDRLHAGLAFPARLLAARPQARAGGVGRAQQRAEERQALHQPRCRHREMKARRSCRANAPPRAPAPAPGRRRRAPSPGRTARSTAAPRPGGTGRSPAGPGARCGAGPAPTARGSRRWRCRRGRGSSGRPRRRRRSRRPCAR